MYNINDMFAHVWWFVEISESAFYYPNHTAYIRIYHISWLSWLSWLSWWVYKLYQIISNYIKLWLKYLEIPRDSASRWTVQFRQHKKNLPCCCYQLQALSGSRLRKSSVTPPKAATGNRGNSWQGKSQSQAAASVGVTMPFWQSGQTYPNPQRRTMLHNVLSLPSLCGRHVCSHGISWNDKTYQNMTKHDKPS